jgi:hypothetical protein
MSHLLKILSVKENVIQHIAGMIECRKLLSVSLGESLCAGPVEKITTKKYATRATVPTARNDRIRTGSVTGGSNAALLDFIDLIAIAYLLAPLLSAAPVFANPEFW